MTTLRNSVRANDTRILVEEVEVPKYYLADRIAYNWQFTGLDFIEYTAADGQTLTGPEGYERAINDGYFGIIAFRYGPSAELATRLTSTITSSGRYESIASEPFTTSGGTGAYMVWRQIVTAQ